MKLRNEDILPILTSWSLVLGFCWTTMAVEPISKLLTDFSDASVAKQWISVNDNVMGGISEGGFRISEDNTLVFSGNLSLENRGGFTSIHTRPKDLNLDGYDIIALRLKGDGRIYYINLMNSSSSAASSYRAPIKTEKDSWQEVRINLNDFVYTTFGRVVARAAPLKAKDVQSLGITLADKIAGPFRLELGWIRAEKGTVTEEAISFGGKDIVDTAVAAGNFNTLIAAVKAAGLVDSLKAEGPMTVFAPTDDAFAKLPEGSIEELLQPENLEKLIAVLSYHVVPGKHMLNTRLLKTLQDQSLTIKTSDSFEVNGINVITSDIETSNGVIHIIDSVLLPPAENLAPKEAAKDVIDLAIRHGVPLFNAGQPSACAAIYEVAIESLLKSHSNTLDSDERSILESSLRRFRSGQEDPNQQAWTLRRALDTVYVSLGREKEGELN